MTIEAISSLQNIDIIKDDLIAQINKRLEDKIIEPTNAELLKKLIINAESTNEAIMIAELGTTYKRTGFHFDKRLEKLGSDIKYLKKNETLSFKNGPSTLTHKLIIGDNYDALQQLLITHRGMIDVIYIDPPYGSDSMGEFADMNYSNAITRDNLISMLYPRLLLAKQLLSDTGVLFCSIDDKNQAYIKCLMDDVFQEQNFIACLPTIINLKGNQDEFAFAGTHEYVIAFAKDITQAQFNEFDVDDELIENEWMQDDIGYYKKGATLKRTGNDAPREKRPFGYFPILINKDRKIETITRDEYTKIYDKSTKVFDDNFLEQLKGKYENLGFKFILPIIDMQPASWRWGYETVVADKEEIIVTDDDTFYKKQRPQLGDLPTKKPKSVLYSPLYSNGAGTNILKSIFNKKPFDNPKSVKLIGDLIYLSSHKNAVILDFFAGSGTTGQAVLELNKKDGGNRKFILCTNNEISNITPNGIAYDVTSKRLKRVMTGECYDGFSNFKWLEKNEPYGDNLDVYDIVSVNAAEQMEGKSPFDVIDETCYDMPNFTSVQEKIAWICNNFENTQKYIKEEE